MKKLKLLIVGAFPPQGSEIIGGIVTACRHLTEPPFSDKFNLILIDTTQKTIPAPHILIRAFYAIRRFFAFAIKIYTEKPDGVLLFVAGEASIAEKGSMAWICRPRHIPVFINPRGARIIEVVEKSAVHKIWMPLMFRGATHFLCQGKLWRDFATKTIGFAPAKTEIIPNWTASNELLSIGHERPAVCQNQIPKILFLAWLEKTKGIFELLEACRRMKDDLRFELIIAGKGNAEEEVKSFISAHQLEDYVRLAGWVRGEEKLSLLRESDIFALPSWAEGFPNALIEAMSAKLAVVVSAVGTIPDFITNGNQALLVQPKNTDELEKSLRLLIGDTKTRETIAASGYSFVKEVFGVESGVKRLAAYLSDVMTHYKLRNSKKDRS